MKIALRVFPKKFLIMASGYFGPENEASLHNSESALKTVFNVAQ